LRGKPGKDIALVASDKVIKTRLSFIKINFAGIALFKVVI
jgi:hypothetical protein